MSNENWTVEDETEYWARKADEVALVMCDECSHVKPNGDGTWQCMICRRKFVPIERLVRVKEGYVEGYEAGHNDTVEGTYGDSAEMAEDWYAESRDELAKKRG